jgi:Delta24-sterol reductase
MERHEKAVAVIADRVRQFYDADTPFRIYHGSTNSTRQSQFQRNAIVDTSQLSHVLKVDPITKTALVEPNVPMDSLVAAAIQFGLVPPVVMEFPGITAGGGFAGTSGESSSFRHGFFENTVNWIEIVLANGDVVTASGSNRPDLFYGAASSYGTLGVTTLLEIRLIEAKTYVELTYHPVSSVPEALKKIESTTKDSSYDYLDGILFAKDRGVVCIGRLTNTVRDGVKTQRFSRAQDPWFYRHAEEILAKPDGPQTEAIPLVDYLFRYDRGAFWAGRYAFRYFITPFNSVTRWALDRFMRTRVMYHALHKSGLAKRYIVQDVAVPYQAADEFSQFLDKGFGFYPLWLCPLRLTSQALDSPYHAYPKVGTLLNFGVWGPGPAGLDEFVAANRKIEQKVQELDGKKALYAHAYYSEEEFWNIYDKQKYDALRAKYNATYLPSIYDKVKVDITGEKKAMSESWMVWLLALFWSIWPLCGLYGVLHVVIGGNYLLPRKSWQNQTLKAKD